MINGSTTTWGRIEFYTDLMLFAFLREMTNYNLLCKVHYSIILGNFGVEKVIADLKRHLFLPRLAKMVAMLVKSCSLCSIPNPTIQKLRKYIPPLVLSRQWTSMSMYFLGGLSTTISFLEVYQQPLVHPLKMMINPIFFQVSLNSIVLSFIFLTSFNKSTPLKLSKLGPLKLELHATITINIVYNMETH
jgi:hypothetical protein